jgi:CDP-paratose 2-epimerase
MEQLSEYDVLLSVWHTPPSLAEGGECAGPPRRLEDFSEFLWCIHNEFGDHFTDLELWNEPNNRLKWAFDRFDPDWSKFARMIRFGAGAAKRLGRRTVLGGMIPVDPEWLTLLETHGALSEIDVVAIHGFPQMWWPDRPNWDWRRDWHGWSEKVAKIACVAGDRPLWITETGLATWDFSLGEEGRLDLQVEMLEQALRAPVERIYWYSLIDLDPDRPAIEGFHVDENEYHLGLVRFDMSRKPAWDCFKDALRRDPIADSKLAPVEWNLA